MWNNIIRIYGCKAERAFKCCLTRRDVFIFEYIIRNVLLYICFFLWWHAKKFETLAQSRIMWNNDAGKWNICTVVFFERATDIEFSFREWICSFIWMGVNTGIFLNLAAAQKDKVTSNVFLATVH